jgi:hypothetical protein
MAIEKHERTTKGFPAWRDKLCNWGMTLKQSSAVHIQALVSADVILLGSISKLRLLVIRRMLRINLTSVPGGQLVNSPTAQSLERWAPLRQLLTD